MKVLRFLKRYQPDIVFLQETHLTENDFHRMNKMWVGYIYGSPAVGGKAGVLTMINRSFSQAFISHDNDLEGRISIVNILCG